MNWERWSQRAHAWFIKNVYADQNKSPHVRDALRRCLSQVDQHALILNVGAGGSRIDPRARNLDVRPGPGIDYVCDAAAIEEADETFDLVLCQELLEHVVDPARVVREMTRVLKQGGLLYIQVPFIIGYHPGPLDLWRFTKEGVRGLVDYPDLEILDSGLSVGSATGYYRVSVEFFSLLLSSFFPRSYRPLKLSFALVLYPLKWFDVITAMSPEDDRIAGGYYLVARRQRALQSSL